MREALDDPQIMAIPSTLGYPPPSPLSLTANGVAVCQCNGGLGFGCEVLSRIPSTVSPRPCRSIARFRRRRHVVLVSADKDGYVPPQSARVQMCDVSVRDAQKSVPHGQVCSAFFVFFCLFGLWGLLIFGFASDGRMFVGGDTVRLDAEVKVLLSLVVRFNTFALPSWSVEIMQGRHYGM